MVTIVVTMTWVQGRASVSAPMEFMLSFRRLPLSEGWSINTYHSDLHDSMQVRLKHTDGRSETLTFATKELMGDLPRCQQKLLTWVAHTIGATVVESDPTPKTRRIELD